MYNLSFYNIRNVIQKSRDQLSITPNWNHHMFNLALEKQINFIAMQQFFLDRL